MNKILLLTLCLFIFGLPEQLQANSLQDIPSISVRAYNGQIIGWDAGGLVTANKSDLSEREFFKIYNISRPDTNPETNDIIVLQASNGHFMYVRDDGRIGLHPDYFNPKVRFQVTVLGINEKGDISWNLKNISTNKFIMAVNGGGAEVNNNALQARQFETFTIRYHVPIDVFIRNAANDFLFVTGPGQLALKTGSEPPANSSFSFIILNRSNTSKASLVSGDTVLIRYRFQYVSISGDGRSFSATSDRGSRSAQFVILTTTATASNLRIPNGIQFTVRSVQSGNYWMSSGPSLTTSSTNTASGNYFVFWRRSQGTWSETGFPSLPSGITSYPFRIISSPKIGIDTVVVFKLRLNEDFSIDDTEINNRLFGAAPSLSSWLRDNSNGLFNVASKGIFGPFQVFKDWSKENYDTLFTMAENSGLNLNIFGNRVWDQNKYKLLLIEPGELWGNKGFVSGTSKRGYRFHGVVGAAGVTKDVNKPSRMVMAHEISHALFDVIDRYPWREPLKGDVVAMHNFFTNKPSQNFTITKRSGSGQIQNGDQVSLKVGDRWVVTAINDPYYLNLVTIFTDLSWYTIITADGLPLTHQSKFFLRAYNGKYVMALNGGNNAVMATAEIPQAWETFSALRKDKANRPILSGDEINIVTSRNFVLDAFVDGKSNSTPIDRKRGYMWNQNSTGGCGGKFDNSTSNYDVVLLNLYDRIRLGWVRQKYLTPDMKGTYLVRPYIGSGDGIILFDPMNPREWYTVENRVRIENRDEIPSSGMIISWVCEDEGYWRSLYSNAKDDDFSGWRVNFPVVLSANNPRIPPNPFFYPPMLNPNTFTQRNTFTTAFCSHFTSHELALPLGNGSPSRFHITISKIRDSKDLLLTIH